MKATSREADVYGGQMIHNTVINSIQTQEEERAKAEQRKK